MVLRAGIANQPIVEERLRRGQAALDDRCLVPDDHDEAEGLHKEKMLSLVFYSQTLEVALYRKTVPVPPFVPVRPVFPPVVGPPPTPVLPKDAPILPWLAN